MIRVSDTSTQHSKSTMTFEHVKVIRGPGVISLILVIWRHNISFWVSFSPRARQMTLEHRLMHLTRDKIIETGIP